MMIPLRRLLVLASSLLICGAARASLGDASLLGSGTKDDVVLVASGKAAPLYVAEGDWPGVQRAARDLQADVERVTGVKPAFSTAAPTAGPVAVLVGTIGRSPADRWPDRERQAFSRGTARQRGIPSSSPPSISRCPASGARSSSPAATSAARSTASMKSLSRSACRRGIGGPTCRSRTAPASPSSRCAGSSANRRSATAVFFSTTRRPT
ncbi:MAG: hypothetical protein WDM96_00685 [Lacunisphaera sp.]